MEDCKIFHRIRLLSSCRSLCCRRGRRTSSCRRRRRSAQECKIHDRKQNKNHDDNAANYLTAPRARCWLSILKHLWPPCQMDQSVAFDTVPCHTANYVCFAKDVILQRMGFG